MIDADRNDRISEAVVEGIEALGSPQRLEILFALSEAEREHRRQWHTLTFTELHDAVAVESSSQFSYHLDRLVDQFVDETSDGYRLTYSGRKLIRSVLSGVYESTATFDERAVDGVCVFCEADSLVATLEQESFLVRCSACDTTLVNDCFPRSQSRNRSPAAIVESFGYRIWSSYVHLRGAICPECYGRVETTVEAHEVESQTRYTHGCSCSNCGFTIHLPVEVAVAFHPAALARFWEHGVSVLDTPLWELFEYVATDAFVTDAGPGGSDELVCTLSLGDESLDFEIDETLRVSPLRAPDQ
ncbi:winged helix-turn-helix domain-containing protein [Halosimplex salinum]|uniref:winged helix-turn-helix domain-containing protein n=1 Tax=Halosimplex salinum TaxID=1710538 RepID=UPI000F46D956|nr:winged helix-turn-helix domain-containing protein [Halosimplex salinum]